MITAGGQGLVATADDYLTFARMLLGGGQVDGKRVLSPESVRMMTSNRLSEDERRLNQFGIPFFMAQGFGLGLSVVLDPARNAWMGVGGAGAFGWPGLFGGWWQVDPRRETVMLWLQQTMPPQAPPGNSNSMADSPMAVAFTRWLFGRPKLLALMSKMAQRSGKAPRMPGVAAVQGFQKETQAALARLA